MTYAMWAFASSLMQTQAKVLGIGCLIGFSFGAFITAVCVLLSVRQKSTSVPRITHPDATVMRYQCPACGDRFEPSQVPKNLLCPRDFVSLQTYDPLEDKRASPL